MEQNDSPIIGEEVEEKPKEKKSEDNMLSMADLLEQEDLNLDLPKQGEVRTGTIASLSDNEILVSIGAKSEGLIPSRELEQLNDEERDKLEVGQDIQVYVVSPENQRGTLLLSYTRSLEEEDWQNAEALLKSREAYEGTVEGFNKGGLIMRMGRLRGFVPASQVSQARRMRYQGDTPEQRWGEMSEEPMVARVIEVDRERRRLILSERAASQESREALKERLLEELGVGEVRTGRVTSLAEFGAFVNINGADGLVHLSELSWERVDHPSELLSVGDEVQVKVISIDQERRRIGLSLRQLQQDPWEDHINEYKVGQLVEGTITRLVKFGAFARLDEHIEGLVHISELSEDRIEHPKEMVAEGDEHVLRIIKIEPERRRIGLSLRKVDSAAFSDMDWEMTLAEIDNIDEKAEVEDPGAELKAALDLTDDSEAEAEPDESPVEEASAETSDEAVAEKAELPEVAEETSAEAADQVEEPEAEAEELPEAVEDAVDEAVEQVEEPVAEAEDNEEAIEEQVEDAVAEVEEKAEAAVAEEEADPTVE
jgi:small subunit ribosomal protein S1